MQINYLLKLLLRKLNLITLLRKKGVYMKGYPKHLNTKEDYEYVRQNFSKEAWEEDFKNLLDTQYDWFFEKELAEGEEGIIDTTHKVVENEQDGKATHSQYKWDYNPFCKLARIGYTEQEVQDILNER